MAPVVAVEGTKVVTFCSSRCKATHLQEHGEEGLLSFKPLSSTENPAPPQIQALETSPLEPPLKQDKEVFVPDKKNDLAKADTQAAASQQDKELLPAQDPDLEPAKIQALEDKGNRTSQLRRGLAIFFLCVVVVGLGMMTRRLLTSDSKRPSQSPRETNQPASRKRARSHKSDKDKDHGSKEVSAQHRRHPDRDQRSTAREASGQKGSSSPPLPQGGVFRFVVWPDTHMEDGPGGVDTPTSLMAEAVLHKIRPGLVVHTGDMIGIKQIPSAAKPEKVSKMWARFTRTVVAPLAKERILFFPTAGNHDIYGARELYRDRWAQHKNMGFQVKGPDGYSGYYSFDYGGAHFVSLFAPGTRSLPDRWNQVAWLRKDLEAAKKRGKSPLFVFNHSPLFCPKMNRRCSYDRKWLDDDEFVGLLSKHKAIYFSGHMHVYHDTVYRGIRCFISGMVGGGRKRLATRKTYQPYQFMVIDVEGGRFRIYRVKYPNMDTSHIPPLAL